MNMAIETLIPFSCFPCAVRKKICARPWIQSMPIWMTICTSRYRHWRHRPRRMLASPMHSPRYVSIWYPTATMSYGKSNCANWLPMVPYPVKRTSNPLLRNTTNHGSAYTFHEVHIRPAGEIPISEISEICHQIDIPIIINNSELMFYFPESRPLLYRPDPHAP